MTETQVRKMHTI